MTETFEQHRIIIQMYIDSAKTYAQLSVGALALSIGFMERVMGDKPKLPTSRVLICSWACFLTSIGAGALYQYCAVKYLDVLADGAQNISANLRYFAERPGTLYGTMLVTFCLGAILLTVAVGLRLRGAPRDGTA